MPGHIEQISKGSWTIIVEAGRDPATNKRKRIKKAFHGRKEEAKKEMARLIAELEKGTYIEPSGLTLAQYIKSWMEDYGKLKLSPTTYRRYSKIVDLRLIPWLGSISLDKIRPYHVQKFYKRVIEEGRMDKKGGPLSAASIIYHHRVLRRILEVAYKHGIIPRNVADQVDIPIPNDDGKDDKDRVEFLTGSQVKVLEGSAKNTPYFGIVFVGVRTGLRRGELLALQWKNIDLQGGTLTVRRSLAYTPDTGTIFKGPKNKRSCRTIDISEEVIIYLRRHHKRQAERKLKQGEEYEDNDLVFCRTNGKPMHPDSVSSWFPVFLEKNKLPRLNFHCLRHTHASLLLALGEDIKLISKRLGHSSVRITYDIYSHLLPEAQKEAVSKLDDLLK